MKVRIGISIGRSSIDTETFDELLDAMVRHRFDSIWLSEVLTGGGLDPFVGLAYVAARQPMLKLGTTMLLPGRNIVRLAKQLASLDVLSKGRLLVTFVPGLDQSPEREAISARSLHRGHATDEALPVLRQLLSGESVTHHGEIASFEDVTLRPLPVQDPLEFWLGGRAEVALRRCGELGDGWLPGICSPEEAEHGRIAIENYATEAGRKISPEHFGVSVPYSIDELDAEGLRAVSSRRAQRDTPNLVPVGIAAIRSLLEQYVSVGFSKFVLRPVRPPESWPDELKRLSEGVGSLQN